MATECSARIEFVNRVMRPDAHAACIYFFNQVYTCTFMNTQMTLTKLTTINEHTDEHHSIVRPDLNRLRTLARQGVAPASKPVISALAENPTITNCHLSLITTSFATPTTRHLSLLPPLFPFHDPLTMLPTISKPHDPNLTPTPNPSSELVSSELVRSWFVVGSELVRSWFGVGSELTLRQHNN